MPFPTVTLESGTSLDSAYEYAVGIFEEAELPVHRPTMINEMPQNPLHDIAKIFTCHPDGENHTFIVYPGEWDQDTVVAVLKYTLSMAGPDSHGINVIAAHPIPDILTYVTATHPRAKFSLETLVQIQEGTQLTPDSASDHSNICQELLKKHFDLTIDIDDAKTLSRLDEFVLSELRPQDDHEADQDGYLPLSALIAIGCLAGEVMIRALASELQMEAAWVIPEQEISSTGLALAITRSGESIGVTNPIGKAIKLFQNGSEDSIDFLYQSVKQIATKES